jgi:H+/Cl- antiporter ClcA
MFKKFLAVPSFYKPAIHLPLYLLAALVGALSGLLAGAFHFTLDRLIDLRVLARTELESMSLSPNALALPGWLLMAITSAMLVCFSLWLVRSFAPEAHGSGIPQVEGVLSGVGRIRWWRVLPVKFLGSICAMAPAMVLGREGPTIHMGAACGQMVAELGSRDKKQAKRLVAAGVAAGLAAAFNAPLAGIMLVTEEMREEFDYSHVSLMCVILASCVAIVVSSSWLGQGLELNMSSVALAPLAELPYYGMLGIIAGVFAVAFNRGLVSSVAWFSGLGQRYNYLAAALVGGLVGALLWLAPTLVGGGEHLVLQLGNEIPALPILLSILLLRFLLSILCYGTGVPGGIFAPLLALGALLGLVFSASLELFAADVVSTPAMFVVAAMGALFAGTVRAPLTAIVLIVELTGAFDASLSVIITCMAASLVAEALGGKPIYSELRKLSADTAR